MERLIEAITHMAEIVRVNVLHLTNKRHCSTFPPLTRFFTLTAQILWIKTSILELYFINKSHHNKRLWQKFVFQYNILKTITNKAE